MRPEKPTSQRNLDRYEAPMIEWDRVRSVLDADLTQAPGTGGPGRHTTWLATTNPDGTPHVMPVGEIRVDGTWYFTSGPGSRKSRNLAGDPRCVVSVAPNASTSCSKAPPCGSPMRPSSIRMAARRTCQPSRTPSREPPPVDHRPAQGSRTLGRRPRAPLLPLAVTCAGGPGTGRLRRSS